MVLKRVTGICLTLIVCSAEATNLCELKPTSVEKTIKINDIPGYFFKVHPDGDYITYISSDSNILLDLKTAQRFPTVGNIDPVWSPDAKFLTHPGRDISPESRGMQFYETMEILEATKKGTHKDVKAAKSDLTGVYQSIGKTKEGSYKIISDKDGVSIQDFSYENKTPGNFSAITKPCANVPQMGTDLPMLSKDGRFLSTYDTKNKSTKIYKLKGKDCDLSLDLGYGTGKVSFNSDSSQIAFHVDQFGEFEDGYFSAVGFEKVKNVVVLNLDETEDGKLNPSSWALASQNTKPGDGGYYPDFDKDGNLYYMEDIGNNFQFVKVSPKNLEFRTMEKDFLFGKSHPVSCDDSATEVLATMWKDICIKENPIPMHEYREFISAIDPKECIDMVEANFVPAMKFSKEELLKSCPKKNFTASEAIGEWDPSQKSNAENLIKGTCIACHTAPQDYEDTLFVNVATAPNKYGTPENVKFKETLPPIDLKKMDSKTINKMLNAISGGKMPKGGSLDKAQKDALRLYLEKSLLDVPEEKDDFSYVEIRRYSEEALQAERDKIFAMNPNVSGPTKEYLTSFVDCFYGQKNCGTYLSTEQLRITNESLKQPEAQRADFVTKKMMELKCNNLIEVTAMECRNFKLQQK